MLNWDAVKPLKRTEQDPLDAVRAIDRATRSTEHHVEVIESLLTSVVPLTDSINRLTETMRELVAMLAPLADEEARARRGERDAPRRAGEDLELQSRMAVEIGRLFPGCSAERAEAIARHAAERGSGRVGAARPDARLTRRRSSCQYWRQSATKTPHTTSC